MNLNLRPIPGLVFRSSAVAVAWFLMLAAAVSRAQDAQLPADNANFHIFVLMGQSNMAGAGRPVLPEYSRASDSVLILGNDLKWTPSKINFGASMGPGQVFARHYAELHPGVTVGLIQGARGARKLEELAKGGKDRDGAPNYDNLLAKIRAAMKVGTLKGALWHQGESGCGDPAYVDKLKALVADLRADVGDPNLPFIAGELGRYATWAGFNTRIPAAATAIPDCAVVSSENLLDLGDKVHFSGFSCEILGSRYLMAYLTMREPQLAAKFKPALDNLTAKMIAKDADWKILLNPAMTDGEVRPLGWDGKWTPKGNLDALRDTADFASAPASLRVESVGGPVTGSVSTPLRNVCGRTFKISGKMKNAGFAGCTLGLKGLDGSWKPVLSQDVIDAKDAKAWTSFTVEFAVPASAVNTSLLFGVTGEGKAWLDDVEICEVKAPGK